MNELLKLFSKPRQEHYPVPFWFLNDALDPQEIKRQIQKMAKVKIGGFFLHARMGRITEYLSEQWLTIVNTAIDEAEKQGLHVWLYDEDNWPSGYAGGKVIDKGDWTRGQFATLNYIKAHKGEIVKIPHIDGIIEAWEISGTEENPELILPISPDTENYLITEEKTTAVLSFSLERHREERVFCPEEKVSGYIDVLNKDVTEAFLESTYELYYKKFGKAFGKTIKGFFIDEPEFHELGLWGGQPRFPWTNNIVEQYYLSCKRNLIKDLPSLKYRIGDYQIIRYEYYKLLSELFVENFTKPIQKWCTGHEVKLTGHLILEEHPRMAARAVGNPMDHYRIMDIPGIDHLGKNIELKIFWSSSIVLCKQAQSAVHQLDKEGVLCETFAGCTNGFSLTDQKWMGDWLMALGVTHITQHAFHYSLRGYRKRDYPPTFNLQQPYFLLSGELHEHFARLSQMLSLGKRMVSLLLIHPMDSIWATQEDENIKGDDFISRGFKRTAELLTKSGYDWDLGNEQYIQDLGKIKNKKLIIGKGKYDLVIIPPGITLRSSTIELLKQFHNEDGTILKISPSPIILNGDDDKKIPDWFNDIEEIGSSDDENLFSVIQQMIGKPFQLELITSGKKQKNQGIENLVFQIREVEDGYLFFVTSSNKSEENHILKLGIQGTLYLLNSRTGEKESFPHLTINDGILVDLNFEAGISYLFLISEDKEIKEIIADQSSSLSYTRESLNTLILDKCHIQFDNEEAEELFTIETREFMKHHPGESFKADFSFSSEIELHEAYLLIETPEKFQIYINEILIPTETFKYLLDKSLKKLNIPDGISAGINIVTIEGEYEEGLEIETLFIAGEFGVFFNGIHPYIDNELDKIKLGSLTEMGYPFYAGTINYELEYFLNEEPTESIVLEIEDCKSPLKLNINGNRKLLTFSPFSICIGDYLIKGKNRIEISISSHLRNFYGPHHKSDEADIDCFSPADHLKSDSWTDEYLLLPVGICGNINVRK